MSLTETDHAAPSPPVGSPVVAVLGGGQLGRMLGLAGIPLGLRFRFLDPSPEATARAVGELVVGALADEDAARRTADTATVVTYEWEGVPAGTARAVMAEHEVRPGPRALEVAQDRLAEKQTFTRLGIGVAPYAAVDGPDDLAGALAAVGLPALLKTRRGGYDGKGQQLVRDVASARAAWDALGGGALLAEGVVPFSRELSVIAARSVDGTTACYPLVENLHERGILRVSRAPAPRVPAALQAAGETIATRLLDDLDYVGVLTVELFEHGGELLANEIAPRVHNSGHWTIEGADTSQFEQHLRAVLEWPLGSTAVRGSAAMVNCIGALPDRASVLAVPGAHLHDYEKAPRSGRKVGHVTVVAPDDAALDTRIQQVRALQRDDG
ncbi:MAG: 5-(carboxyamino)imidazole ribonucleotide synthase [Acidimicrobiia bacterium]